MKTNHEILGTDKPIYFKKHEGQFLYEELCLLDKDPKDYEIMGYVMLPGNKKTLFDTLYRKRK